jgi:TetR/AcrR family transcriptional repressor of lmrAB and yxaGH operons
MAIAGGRGRGREQVTGEAVLLVAAELGAQMRESFDRAPDLSTAVVTLGALFARPLAESGYREGCPVTAVAVQIAGENEAVRAACAQAYGGWLQDLAHCLRQRGVPAAEAVALAEVILSGIQGALLLARVRKDCAPIHQVTARLGALASAAARR